MEDAELLNILENRAVERDRLQQATLNSYVQYGTPVVTADDVPIKMKGRVVDLTEEEKPEKFKDKILESLKPND